jgi:protein TonB
MQGLVAFEEVNLPEEEDVIFVNVAYETPTTTVERKTWIVNPPELIERPDDETEFEREDVDPKGPSITVTGPPKGGPGRSGDDIGLSLYNEGDMVPIVRVEPQFPKRAAEREIQGWVVVEFTVTADGNVEDAFIVDAEPVGYFERASLKAVNKFRYKPRVVDGVARDVPNVRTRFSFSLEDDE